MKLDDGGPVRQDRKLPEDLRGRMPGQSVIAELLREQAQVRPRAWWGRLLGTSPLTPDTEPWYKGALGEIEVGRILSGLGPGYEVLHAVPVGKADSDIDHVVIGPAGVFTLNTKNHSGQKVWVAGGTFMVGGHKPPHIHSSVFEAKRAAKRLSTAAGRPVEVAAMLVLIEPVSLDIKSRPDGVEILTASRLKRWLSRQPQRLQAAEVEHIAAAARAPGVWHENPPASQDQTALAAGFEALHRSVTRARRHRIAWGLVMMGGSVAAAVAAVAPLAGSVYAGLLGG